MIVSKYDRQQFDMLGLRLSTFSKKFIVFITCQQRILIFESTFFKGLQIAVDMLLFHAYFDLVPYRKRNNKTKSLHQLVDSEFKVDC